MSEHWRAGYHDARRTLRHPEAVERQTNHEGVSTFDLAVDGREYAGMRARRPGGARHDDESAMPQCAELSIDEMLTDPIVRALMTADGVDPGELKALLRLVAGRRRARASDRSRESELVLQANARFHLHRPG